MALRVQGTIVVNNTRDVVNIVNVAASGTVTLSSTTLSTSNLTGALIVAGGVGVNESVWAGELRTISTAIRLGQDAGSTNQGTEAVAIGAGAGYSGQGTLTVAIGSGAGEFNQGNGAVAIGDGAGSTNQGIRAVAIGINAGPLNQLAGSIIINASTSTLNGTNAGLYINPVRSDATTSATSQAVYYNTTTKELTYATACSVSDARDKTDFAYVPHGIDFVSKLKPIAYRYKTFRSDTAGIGPVRYGFKAQDVLELEGNTPVIVNIEDLEKLRFNDQSMIAVLVVAIQELKAEFDQYKATHP